MSNSLQLVRMTTFTDFESLGSNPDSATTLTHTSESQHNILLCLNRLHSNDFYLFTIS